MRVLEGRNRECYDLLAEEYDFSDHETLRDFDRCTQSFIHHFVQNYLDVCGQKYSLVDIGVGTGIATCRLGEVIKLSKVSILDISSKMLDVARKKINNEVDMINAPVLDWSSDFKYDIVTGIMSDPYLSKDVLRLMSKHLNVGGYAVLSFPNIRWACQTRDDLMFVEFNTATGVKCKSLSLCFSREVFSEMLSGLELHIASHITYYIVDGHRMSLLNRGLIDRLGVNSYPFCECYVLRRGLL